MEKRKKRGRDVSTKWVGLVGPIKTMWSSCVVVEIVFGLVVVFDDMGQFVLLFLFNVCDLRMLCRIVRRGRER